MPSGTERKVRICKIASRYLVFDIQDVAFLRRHHNICAVFVGTMPQNPTQNVFMGLPVELLPEEASVLVAKSVAYIVDDTAAHLRQLTAMDDSTRRAYIQSLRTQRRKAQQSLDEEKAARTAEARARLQKKAASKQTASKQGGVSSSASRSPEGEESLFGSSSPPVSEMTPRQPAPQLIPGITPATSNGILGSPRTHTTPPDMPEPCPLYAHLNARGYFITPGLRFGGHYSVYPGDPFRYHAHFLATSYGWDDEIPMLELIGSGRLGTAVKKGFLLGGKKPEVRTYPGAGNEGEQNGDDGVRTFCIEWAGM
ncbi:hypothetical protein VTK73DRAFT_1184 [Phialemonium thermophilum]|uniref:tRNA-splicing endonuclease subunit Sen34 n=1 Tax=Phialemonium thermophilum TaxID=223376 RepID=A0ABR3VTS4_9PEZI